MICFGTSAGNGLRPGRDSGMSLVSFGWTCGHARQRIGQSCVEEVIIEYDEANSIQAGNCRQDEISGYVLEYVCKCLC